MTANDTILLLHASLGVLGTVAALWVFVETLNVRAVNLPRIRSAAVTCAVFMSATAVAGGYWYLHFYPPERALVLSGPWPFAHNIFMETKEHLFLMTLVLALYLPIAAMDRLTSSSAARRMVLSVSLLIALTGLSIEGAGAIVDHGVKVALLRPKAQGGEK